MKNQAQCHSGKPCRKCGTTLKYVSNYSCVNCKKSPETKMLKKLYKNTLIGRASYLCGNAKFRAKKRNLPFSITPEVIYQRLLVTNLKCEVTGVSLHMESINAGSGFKHPFAPSLDQKIPGLGYTEDNIQIVVDAYNLLKGTRSDTEAKSCLLEMARGIQWSA